MDDNIAVIRDDADKTLELSTRNEFTNKADLLAEIQRLRTALTDVKDGIMRADPDVLTDTLWMPEDIAFGATVVDHIDYALQQWSIILIMRSNSR